MVHRHRKKVKQSSEAPSVVTSEAKEESVTVATPDVESTPVVAEDVEMRTS